jgi:arylsulfatase A-like enzyme
MSELAAPARVGRRRRFLPHVSRHSSRHLPRRIATLPILALLLVTSQLVTVSPVMGEPSGRPNIVFIMADDLGWNDVGYHDSDIKTPRLDRLAAEGVRLAQHYVTPVCWTTRECLLLGRGTAVLNAVNSGDNRSSLPLPPDTTGLAAALRSTGYTTHISGKWHINSMDPELRPLKHGFDTSYGYLHGQIDPYLPHKYKLNNKTWHRNDVMFDEPGHVTDLLTDEALRVIESDHESPFFLYVAYSVPHYPLDEPEEWIKPYEGRIEDPWRRLFAASVSHLDDAVGRIVDSLKRSGQRENTILVFVSDNGGQKSWKAPKEHYDGRYKDHTTLGDNRPLNGWKAGVYEGGIRVASIVSWPGRVPVGSTVDEVVCVLDWMPTFCGLAGHRVDLDGGGQDIWPVIAGKAEPRERTLRWKYGGKTAVRAGDWKLVVGKTPDRAELFNLADDPCETKNLASQMPDKVAQLTALISKH